MMNRTRLVLPRRSLLAGAALLMPGTSAAQETNVPRLHRSIGDGGWTLHADASRVEIHAAPSLCSNVRFAVNDAPLPEGAAGYRLGEPSVDFAVRFALVFASDTAGLPNDMAAFAGIAFTTPTEQGDFGVSADAQRMAMFSVRAGAQNFGMVALRHRASIDGWLVLMLSDTREALRAMEYEPVCQVAFGILARGGATELGLMFDLDTSGLGGASRALFAEFNRRSDLLAQGASFEPGNMR